MILLRAPAPAHLARHPWQFGLSVLGIALGRGGGGVDRPRQRERAPRVRPVRRRRDGRGRRTRSSADPAGFDERARSASHAGARRATRSAPVVEGWVGRARPRRAGRSSSSASIRSARRRSVHISREAGGHGAVELLAAARHRAGRGGAEPRDSGRPRRPRRRHASCSRASGRERPVRVLAPDRAGERAKRAGPPEPRRRRRDDRPGGPGPDGSPFARRPRPTRRFGGRRRSWPACGQPCLRASRSWRRRRGASSSGS